MLAGNTQRICATWGKWVCVCEREGVRYYVSREGTINGNVGDVILVVPASAEETNKAVTDSGLTVLS